MPGQLSLSPSNLNKVQAQAEALWSPAANRAVCFFEGPDRSACPWGYSKQDKEQAMRDMLMRQAQEGKDMARSAAGSMWDGLRSLRDQFEIKSGVVSESDQDKYKMNVYMGPNIEPQDIKVSVKDGIVSIEAKHEKKSEDGSHRAYQEVSRKFPLPKDVNAKEVKCQLCHPGVLQIEAPLPQKAAEARKPRPIPVKHE